MFPYMVCLYISHVPFGVKIDTFFTAIGSEPYRLPACENRLTVDVHFNNKKIEQSIS